MSATHDDERGVITYDHHTPSLDVLELDGGDKVLYDTEEPDAYLQVDPGHMERLDGRWR